MNHGPQTIMPTPVLAICERKCSTQVVTVLGKKELKRSRCKKCGARLIKY